MKYKLLVLDVDGTLLNNEMEISKRTLAALLKVQHMGIRIVLASGRPTSGLMPLAKALELGNFGGFILAYNGCQVIKAGTGEVMFMLEYDYWLDGVGREPRLSHAESYVAEIKYVKSLDQLYTLSSGGVLRIYDMASGKMLQCVPLPDFGPKPGCIYSALTYWYISDNGTTVEYAFADEDIKYTYHVVTLQELTDSVRPHTDKRIFSTIEKNAYYLSD